MTFECAANETGFDLSFVTYPSVNGSVSSSTGIISLNLTATSEVNGTNVTCQVHSDKVPKSINDGDTTEPAYVFVQGQYNTFFCCMFYYSYLMGMTGPPDSVSNLTGYQLDSCCMFISWYPPFTLPGLTVQYIISVGTDQQYLNDSITNYTYCPMNLTNKQYLFNITTTNKAGNGPTSNITVEFQTSK